MALKVNKGQLRAVAILAVAAVFILILGPTLRAVGKISLQVRMLKNKISTVESDIAGMGRLKEKLDQLKTKVNDFEAKLITQENAELLLEELSNMASSAQVKITGIKPQKPQVESKALYAEFPIVVDAKGGYHSLGTFVNKLEYARYFLAVNDIKIEVDPENPTSHNCRLAVVAYTSAEKR